MTLRVCVDFGSTYTKACVVDLGTSTRPPQVLARTSHRTTVDTDVLEGWAACRADLERQVPGAGDAPVLACSSAGGGLRIAVVGNEQLVTSEAGRRVALSSGGRVVHVASGPLDAAALEALVAARPDVLLLAGGTDGGNAEVLEHNARALAGSGPAITTVPVVVAGNADAAVEVAGILAAAGVPTQTCANVMPRIGAFTPEPARAALRAMFLSHVIGGKHLSAGEAFAAMVRGATPDLMLAAVELMAGGPGGPGVAGAGWGDVVVVDVGGATTDVYSVVEVDPESAGRDVVGLVPATRTVEGDLGMRWSAVSTVAEAVAAGLVPAADQADAERRALARQDDPGLVPATDGDPDPEASDVTESGFDLRLAGWSAALAVRRHAGRAQVRFDSGGGSGPARLVERTGTDLREVGVVVGSGGVLRHAADPGAAVAVLTEHLTGPGAADGGWQVPERARVVLDRDHLLMPAGLLAADHPEAAYALLTALG
ncbi:glutamate mutase [Nocardioides sp. HDW12B]|uniref:glutamate mutase L n=1 Tax=Nocardioides sp. HDW12B TaxID=2714939 RepID=UPI00140D6829|nr:glutamate mutase L [Nocardioides sp. HDW12B]QIK67523.1 glutamate mutase [Nocardioides sp. HDW12B]